MSQLTIYDCGVQYDWSHHVPATHEIETFTGRYVNLEEPRPYMICLEDIAQGLANTCRYNGQVKFYSVAQHAVLCSLYLRAKGFGALKQLAGLHHDDSEAYLGDVTRPLKSLLQPAYGRLSDHMDEAIVEALDLPWSGDALHFPEVKEADNYLLSLEAEELLPSKGRFWGGQSNNWGLGQGIQGARVVQWSGRWSPEESAARFEAMHIYLTNLL